MADEPFSFLTFDPLKRPDDYDPEAVWAKYDFSKVRRYQSPLGFEYWLDIPKNAVRTSDPEIHLSLHSYFAHGYSGHSYAELHFDGCFVVLTQDHNDPEKISFGPRYSEKTEDGAQIWHIDQIFRTFTIPDGEGYPWVSGFLSLPMRAVQGMDHFESRAQQDRFIALVTTLFSCLSGSSRAAMDGEITKGVAVFGEDLKAKLESGAFIA